MIHCDNVAFAVCFWHKYSTRWCSEAFEVWCRADSGTRDPSDPWPMNDRSLTFCLHICTLMLIYLYISVDNTLTRSHKANKLKQRKNAMSPHYSTVRGHSAHHLISLLLVNRQKYKLLNKFSWLYHASVTHVTHPGLLTHFTYDPWATVSSGVVCDLMTAVLQISWRLR